MRHLKLFHRDVLTLRSHQWKYYVEPYSGCALQCTYCLYWESPAFVERLNPPADLLQGIELDLAAMLRKQIVYIGATIDPYQALEKKLLTTRQILERLLEHELPVVILTKSPLILRDMDLLLELNRRGLALVQFTVLTTDEAKARAIERAAPSVAQRLEAAATLSAAGIPVHFHLSPVIPGLYSVGELNDTVRAIADHGGRCIYSNILGMRHLNTGVWLDSLKKLPLAVAEGTRACYVDEGDSAKNVFSPKTAVIYDEMSRLRDICLHNGVDFICEFIPGLNAFDASRFEEGIFRYGLPTVYQMFQLFDGQSGRQRWAPFAAALRDRYAAVDDEYLAVLKEFWDNGQLFENTTITSDVTEGERMYVRIGRLQLATESVLAWD